MGGEARRPSCSGRCAHVSRTVLAMPRGSGAAIARRQGQDVGVDPETMRTRVRSGRWQRLQRGVYAAFSGEPARETVLWAALLRAGPGAVLSHQTAAERHGLIDEPSPVITITVPASRHPARGEDSWRRHPPVGCDPADQAPAMLPPCTRVEDTVLDLIQIAPTFDDAYAWICRGHWPQAHHRRPDTPGHGRPQEDALAPRARRWRSVTPEMASCRCWNTATSTGWNARTGSLQLAAGAGSGSAPGTNTSTTSMRQYGCAVETRRDRGASRRRAVA